MLSHALSAQLRPLLITNTWMELTMTIANADTHDLIPLNRAVRQEVPGSPSVSTVWRWATKGLLGETDESPRIKLEVLYSGSRPYTTKQAIREFLERATTARLARIERTQQQSAEVSDAELDDAGLR